MYKRKVPENEDKKNFEKNGFITYKSSDPHIKVRPSYLDIPSNQDWRPEPVPTVKLNHPHGYPRHVRMILKSPGPFYSFLGHNIARDWCKSYGLTANQGSYLMVMSFHEVFYLNDFRLWCFNTNAAKRAVRYLCDEGFVKTAAVPSAKGGHKKKIAYVLTTLGTNFVNGYEAFYNQKMEIIRQSLGTSDAMQRRTATLMTQDKKEKQIKEELWNARILGTQPKKSDITLIPLKKE